MSTTLRVAVRRFGPFESGIVAQFADYCRASGADAVTKFFFKAGAR